MFLHIDFLFNCVCVGISASSAALIKSNSESVLSFLSTFSNAVFLASKRIDLAERENQESDNAQKRKRDAIGNNSIPFTFLSIIIFFVFLPNQFFVGFVPF